MLIRFLDIIHDGMFGGDGGSENGFKSEGHVTTLGCERVFRAVVLKFFVGN
jgi:hypothetical protein